MDFLNKLLAGFLDKFKAKSPFIYAIVVAVIIAITAGLDSILGVDGLDLPAIVQTVSEWAGFILLALVNSSTFKFSNPDKVAK